MFRGHCYHGNNPPKSLYNPPQGPPHKKDPERQKEIDKAIKEFLNNNDWSDSDDD